MNSRKSYIDIAKGVAMLLVIIGHCNDVPIGLKQWLYSFHIPLFFALSGYTFRRNRYATLKELLIHKFHTLIVPYFYLSIVLWVLCLLVRNKLHFEIYHIDQLMGIILGWRLTKYYFSMWFILTLFFTEVLLWIILKYIDGNSIYELMAAIVSFLVGVIILKDISGLLWSIDLVPVALAFVLVGHVLKIFVNEQSARSKCIYLSGVAAWCINVVFCFRNHFPDMYSCNLGNPVFFVITACSGIVGTIIVCILVKRCVVLEYIGKNSMVYYAFQASFALPVASKVMNIVEQIMPIPIIKWIYIIAVVTVACSILTIMSVVINKWFSFMLGKEKK